MESDDKIIFDDLFSKLSVNINNYKSDNYLYDLISILKIRNTQNNKEIYKYTIFFFITNREKISYLLNSKEKELEKRESLKIHMEKFIKQDNIYSTTNEMFFSFFPEVFQNINKKENRNNPTEKINQNFNYKSSSTNSLNMLNIQTVNQSGVSQIKSPVVNARKIDLNKDSLGIYYENLKINQNRESQISMNTNNMNSPCDRLNMKIIQNKEKLKTNQAIEIGDRISKNIKHDDTNNIQMNSMVNNVDNPLNKQSIEESSSNKSEIESFNPFKNLINLNDLIKKTDLNEINNMNNSNNVLDNNSNTNKNIINNDSNVVEKVIANLIQQLNNIPDANESSSNKNKQIPSKESQTILYSKIEPNNIKNLVQSNCDNIKSSYSILNQNQISSQSQSNLVSSLYPLSNQDKKAFDKSLSKYNLIIKNFENFNSSREFLEDYILKLFKENTNYLFPIPEKFEFFSDEQKLNLLTIYSKFFSFFYDNQKVQIKEKFTGFLLESLTDRKSAEIIRDILFYDPKFKTISELKKPFPKDFVMYTLKNVENQKQIQDYVLDLIKSCKEKEDVMDLFFIFTINNNFFFLNAELQYKLLFFLYIILCKSQIFLTCAETPENQNFLEAINLVKIYHKDLGADFNKTFLYKKRDNDVNININESIYYLNQKLSEIGRDIQDFEKLFSEYDLKFCNSVISAIQKFFKFENEIDLLTIFSNHKNFEFTMNIVELISKKEFLIYQNPKRYRTNLEKIEKKLYNNYTNFNKNLELKTSLYSNQHRAYEEVLIIIDNTLNNRKFQDNKLNVTLYPFGSVTQFLGTGESDLDMYMDITGSKKDKIAFLKTLTKEICKFYRFSTQSIQSMTVISSRLITITYENRHGIKIDLNYFGICSVLNSTLLRIYSIIDTRLVILAHNIKIITKQLGINNTDNSKVYLNSFSLMMLLLTFLQDIVSPPVLPKILKNSEKIFEKIESGNKIKKEGKVKKYNFNKKKTFEEVIEGASYKEYYVNYDFQSEYENIYKRFLEEHPTRNQMTLAELFLKFIEFLIFYFKYDSVFVYCGFSPGEGFYNKSDLNNFDSDQKFIQNLKTFLKKGDILIREPFDHGYNPAQSMEKKNTEVFVNELKNFYFYLIENGELEK